MKMKKYFVLMLVVLTGIVSSCKYDDDELWDNVNDLARRISALETLTNQMNGDISAMKTIISALENQVAVSEVEKLTDGYILHFTDGTKATIKNGKDGADGTDGTDGKDGVDGVNGKDGADGANAPIINVKQDNGIYYWTITVDGETTWLTDDAGNKLPVNGTNGKDGADGEDGKDGADGEDGKDGADGTPGTPGADGENGKDGADGKDGIVPQLKVDAEGYWTVSYDNGVTFDYVLNSEGKKVYAIGEKGDKGNTGSSGSSGSSGSTGSTGATGPQGPQGSKGPKGDTKYQSVTVSGNVVIITMTDTYNNEEFRFPLASSVLYYTSSTTQDNKTLISTSDVIGLSVNETKALYYALSQWDANSISVEVAKKPEGIEIDIDESKKEITVKAENSVSDGKVILFFYTENQTITSVLNFAFAATAATVADVNTILANNSNVDNLIVNIDGNIGSGDEILLSQATDGTIRTFVFAGTSSSITIKDDTNTGNFAGQVIIEVPEGIVLPSITENIPDGEVYIKQGEVTTLVTTASSYTTIIGANAKVGSITVNKGNVRFEKGLEAYPTITKGEDNSNPLYIIYDNQSPKIENDDKEKSIFHISALEHELIRAAAEGSKVNLDRNLSIKNAIKVAENKSMILNLNGYTLTYTGNDILFRALSGATLTINGTTDGSSIVTNSTDPTGTTANGYIASANGGKVIVNGGSYIAKQTCTVFQTNKGELSIHAGRFEAKDQYGVDYAGGARYQYTINNMDKTDSKINISGGTFVNFDPAHSRSESPMASFVANGYYSYKSAANEWSVVSNTTETEVTEGREVISILSQGGMVKLASDVTVNGDEYPAVSEGRYYFTKKATLNLNGHTLSYTGNDVLFRIGNGGDITINGETDESKIYTNPNTLGTGGNGYIALVAEGGNVTFNGGEYVLEKTCTVAQSSGGTVVVEAGTFNAKQKGSTWARGKYTFNCLDKCSENGNTLIQIKGGTFLYFNPGNHNADPQGHPTSYLANGYESYMSAANEWTVITSPKVDENNYLITSVPQMLWFADQVNNMGNNFNGKTVKLGADIDLAGINWTPIGSGTTPFEGTFDGDNYQVKNLTVDLIEPATRSLSRSTNNMRGAGLFGVVKNAIFKNVTIAAAKVNGTISDEEKAHGAGALVGCAIGSVKIEKVNITKDENNTATTVEGSQNVGSIVGYISGDNIVVTACAVNNTNLSASSSGNSAGGVIGQLEVTAAGTSETPTVTITNCEVSDIELDATSGETSTVGGVIGSLTSTDGVEITEDTVNVTENSVKETTVVVSDGTVNQGSVVGNSTSLGDNISGSFNEGNTTEEIVVKETGSSSAGASDFVSGGEF